MLLLAGCLTLIVQRALGRTTITYQGDADGGRASVSLTAMPVAIHICPDHMSREDYKRAIGELEKAGLHEPEGAAVPRRVRR